MKKIVCLFVCLFVGSANASLIGVFGDYSGGVNSLTNSLTNSGHTVISLGTSVTQDLSTFDSVWGVSAYNAISSQEQNFLSSYLLSGGGLYLTGERPCCEILNGSVTSFVNNVVTAGGIQVGGIGDQGNNATINQNIVGGLSNSPNAIATWSPSASGGISGLSINNIFATSDLTGNAVAAAWDMGDLADNSGRMVLMMDVNWLGGQLNVLENIEVFLAGAGQGIGGPVSVPEPTSLALLGLGLVGIGFSRKKKTI